MIESIRKDRDWKVFLIFSVLFSIGITFCDDKEVFYNIAGVLWAIILLSNRRIKLGLGDAIVVVATFYCSFAVNGRVVEAVEATLKMMAVYQVAKNLVNPDNGNPDEPDGEAICDRVAIIVILVAFGFFIRALMNYSYYLTYDAFLWKGEWPRWEQSWAMLDYAVPNSQVLSHDLHQFYLIMMGSILPYFVLKKNLGIVFRITGIIMSLFSFWLGTLSTGGLGFICCLSAVAISLIVFAGDRGELADLKFWIVAGAVIDAITCFVVLAKLNTGGLGDWVSSTIWSRSDKAFYTERFSVMGKALSLLPGNLMGNYDDKLATVTAEREYHAFNSWIDTGVQYGIIPFVLYLLLLVAAVMGLVYFCRRYSGAGKYVMIATFAGVSIYHMLEPATQVRFIFWDVEIFLMGLCIGLYETVADKGYIVISYERLAETLRNRSYILIVLFVSFGMAFATDRIASHFAIAAIAWGYLVLRDGSIRIEIGDLLLFFGMFIFILNYGEVFLGAVGYAFMTVTVYQLGKGMAGWQPYNSNKTHDDAVTRVMYAVITFGVAMFIRGLCNYQQIVARGDDGKYHLCLLLERDFHNKIILRTQQAFFLVMISSLLVCFIYILKKNIIAGVIGVFLSCIAVIFDLMDQQGRLVTVCSVSALIIVTVAYIIDRNLYRKRWVQVTGGIVIVAIVSFVAAFSLNVRGIHDRFMGSFLARGGGIVNNVRFQLIRAGFWEMLKNPLYGSKGIVLNYYNYRFYDSAHNSWVDIGKFAGVIPFVLTVTFTVIVIISMVSLWKNCENISKYVLIAGFIGIMIYNMFEPAILNNVLFWNALVFYGGLGRGLAEPPRVLNKEVIIRLSDTSDCVRPCPTAKYL